MSYELKNPTNYEEGKSWFPKEEK
jgi:hypothetical protein